jgi:actin-related protein
VTRVVITSKQGFAWGPQGPGEGLPNPLVHLPNLVGRSMVRPAADTGSVAAGGEGPGEDVVQAVASSVWVGAGKVYAGPELLSAELQRTLHVWHPMAEGEVTDWRGMREVWTVAFIMCFQEEDRLLGKVPCSKLIVMDLAELRRRCAERYVLQTVAANCTHASKEQIVLEMLTHFQFKGVNVSVQAELCLKAMGLCTGLVVDSGDGCTHIVPVMDDRVFVPLVRRVNLAGRHVTSMLGSLANVAGVVGYEQGLQLQLAMALKEKVILAPLTSPFIFSVLLRVP